MMWKRNSSQEHSFFVWSTRLLLSLNPWSRSSFITFFKKSKVHWGRSGKHFYHLGRHEQADPCSEIAVDIESPLVYPWESKSDCLRDLGRLENAFTLNDRSLVFSIFLYVSTMWDSLSLRSLSKTSLSNIIFPPSSMPVLNTYQRWSASFILVNISFGTTEKQSTSILSANHALKIFRLDTILMKLHSILCSFSSYISPTSYRGIILMVELSDPFSP